MVKIALRIIADKNGPIKSPRTSGILAGVPALPPVGSKIEAIGLIYRVVDVALVLDTTVHYRLDVHEEGDINEGKLMELLDKAMASLQAEALKKGFR